MTPHLRRAMLLTTIVLVVLAALTIALPAHANPSLPSADATGAITIDRVDTFSVNGQRADGTAQPIQGTPLAGVTFRVRQITHIGPSPVDLTTPAGWQQAANLSAQLAPGQRPDPEAVTYAATELTGITDAGGRVRFDNLDLGLYFVEEIATPVGYMATIPFLVTLPMAHPAGNGWMYEVYVQPKADALTVTKTVDNTTVSVGAAVTWTVRADIPTIINPEQTLTKYQLTDLLDPRLQFLNATLNISGPGAPALEESDYRIETTPTPDGTQLVVMLETAGLKILNSDLVQANPGRFHLNLKIRTSTLEAGFIENQAHLAVATNTDETSLPSIPSNLATVEVVNFAPTAPPAAIPPQAAHPATGISPALLHTALGLLALGGITLLRSKSLSAASVSEPKQ